MFLQNAHKLQIRHCNYAERGPVPDGTSGKLFPVPSVVDKEHVFEWYVVVRSYPVYLFVVLCSMRSGFNGKSNNTKW